MTIVDSHLHVWSDNPEVYPWDTRFMPPPQIPATAEMLLEEMEAAGVDKAVLVQPSHYAYDNTYLAHCLKRYPGRFAGVALLDPLDPQAPQLLERLYLQDGIQGMRLYPIRDLNSTWLSDPATFPLWEKADELGVPFICFIVPQQMPMLEVMLARFPDVKVVIDHMGRPSPDEAPPYPLFRAVVRAGFHPNAYVKVSALPVTSREEYPHRDAFRFVRMLYGSFGAQRMMWATDFPHILGQCGYRKALELVQTEIPFFTPEDREWILGRTALSVWRFQ
jgi:predicted TIM-barrel fold metal-dependent hydrolase